MSMNAKEYFRRVLTAEQNIRVIQVRRAHYMEMATGSGFMGGDVRKAPVRHASRIETAGIALAELSAELSVQEQEYVFLVREAQQIIAKVDRARLRQVLELRYLCGLPWREITERMGYTDQKSAYRVHGWALTAANKILNGD